MKNETLTSYKTRCTTCGARHDEVIKRLRGIIYTEVSTQQHDAVVASIKKSRVTYAEALKYHGFERVQLKPLHGTGAPFYCAVCLPAAARKQPKTNGLKDQQKLF